MLAPEGPECRQDGQTLSERSACAKFPCPFATECLGVYCASVLLSSSCSLPRARASLNTAAWPNCRFQPRAPLPATAPGRDRAVATPASAQTQWVRAWRLHWHPRYIHFDCGSYAKVTSSTRLCYKHSSSTGRFLRAAWRHRQPSLLCCTNALAIHTIFFIRFAVLVQ